MAGAGEIDRDEVEEAFHRAVNMSADEIEAWLETDESRSVGQRTADGDSIGRASGRRIVAILRADSEALTHDDYLHMRKVTGFVRRHTAREPLNIVTSRWRYSLMNWGHDPLGAQERKSVRGVGRFRTEMERDE